MGRHRVACGVQTGRQLHQHAAAAPAAAEGPLLLHCGYLRFVWRVTQPTVQVSMVDVAGLRTCCNRACQATVLLSMVGA